MSKYNLSHTGAQIDAAVSSITAAVDQSTATAADILTGKKAVTASGLTTGTAAAAKPEMTKTVTPTAAGLTVTPDTGKVLSKVTVAGDIDLTAANVKTGVNIFGVTGTLSPALPTMEKTVTPTAAQQAITPDSGKTLSKVTVTGDTDLVPANIVSGVNIFGVTGTASTSGKPEMTKTVTPTAAGFTVTPDTGKTLSSVVINGDTDLTAANVKTGVNIFGVTGTLSPALPTMEKTVTPTAAQQAVTPDSGKTLSKVTVTGDADLTAANIKQGVDIFGVMGTLPPALPTHAKTVKPAAAEQFITPNPGYTLSSVTVEGDGNLYSGNIKSGVGIFGVTGTLSPALPTMEKTVTPSAEQQAVTPDAGKTLSKVTVTGDADLVPANIVSGVNIFGVTGTASGSGKPEMTKTVTPTAAGLTVTPDAGKTLSSVTVTGDTDLVAANIKSGVNIFGVTGTMSGALPTQTKSVTPSGSRQTVNPDSGYSLKSVIVIGDSDLTAANVKKGVEIFGITGSYEGTVQMASGTVTDYLSGINNIIGLSFKPRAVICYAKFPSMTDPIYNAVVDDGTFTGKGTTISISANKVTGQSANGVTFGANSVTGWLPYLNFTETGTVYWTAFGGY